MSKKVNTAEAIEKTEESMESLNIVTIRGNIVKKSRTQSALIIVLATSNPVTKKTDFPRVVSFEENMDVYDKEFTTGDRITVTGAIQTSRKYPEGTVLIHSIEKALTRMDAEFTQGEFLTDVNKVLIKGVMAGEPYHPNDSVTIIPVKIKNGEYLSFPRIVCFGNLATRALHKKSGDPVEILGYVQAHTKEKNGKRVQLQSIVAQNLR